MTDTSTNKLIETLDTLLDEERRALVTGDLEKIGQLMSQKEEIIQQINSLDQLENDTLAAVHEKVTRNQALLNSALDGIRAVANRMADLRRVRASLETYDHRGQKQNFGVQIQSTVEKRA